MFSVAEGEFPMLKKNKIGHLGKGLLVKVAVDNLIVIKLNFWFYRFLLVAVNFVFASLPPPTPP